MRRTYWWLYAATKKIRFSMDRERVWQELEGHIQERMEAGEERGLSRDEAEKAAVAAMGDPEALAEELGRLHAPYWGWLWRVSQWALGLVLVWSLLAGAWPRALEDLWGYLEGVPEVELPPVVETSRVEYEEGKFYETTSRLVRAWQDLELGEAGGYRWSVPVAYLRCHTQSEDVPADVPDYNTLTIYLAAESWRFWERWEAGGTLFTVTDNTGYVYPDWEESYIPRRGRIGTSDYIAYSFGPYTGYETCFSVTYRVPDFFSAEGVLEITSVPHPEALEWLEVTVGGERLRIDLRGGEVQ